MTRFPHVAQGNMLNVHANAVEAKHRHSKILHWTYAATCIESCPSMELRAVRQAQLMQKLTSQCAGRFYRF